MLLADKIIKHLKSDIRKINSFLNYFRNNGYYLIIWKNVINEWVTIRAENFMH